MKILVIGNTGFIGDFLTKELISKGHTVIGLDIRPPSEEQKKLCKHITGDILNRNDVKEAAQGADMVIALAAKHHDFGVTRNEFFNVNVQGTEILLDCLSELNIKKLIFYSSVAVYGTQKEPTNENTTPRPDNDYGESKLAAEELIEQWVTENKSRCAIIIRPTVIFGPHNYANVYNLIDKIYRKNFIFVGDGKNIKSVAYVENLVDANIFLIDKFKPGIQIFNYSDEPQMTIDKTVEIIGSYMPHGIPKVKIPLVFAVAFGSIFDIVGNLIKHNFPITGARMKKFATSTHHKANKIRTLGFDQRIATKEGFRRMVKWYLKSQSVQ